MILVLIWLRRHSALPPFVIGISGLNLFVAGILLAISWLRFSHGIQPATAAAACAAMTGATVFCLWRLGRQYGIADLQSLLTSVRGKSSLR